MNKDIWGRFGYSGLHFVIWFSLMFMFYSLQLIKFSPLNYGDGSMLILFTLGTLLNASIFYLSYAYIYPKWRSGARLKSILVMMVYLIFAMVSKAWILWFILTLYGKNTKVVWEIYPSVFPATFLYHLAFMIFGGSLRLGFDYIEAERKRKELEVQKARSELAFLKTRVNPHFLFNTLNNLYGLAVMEGAERTSESLLKLADMMRYMVHENTRDFLPIDREIAYINDYLVLQKLRISKKMDVDLQFNIVGDTAGVKIPPMLLITLVENAFKYGLSFKKPSRIIMNLEVNGGELRFSVENSRHRKEDGLDTTSGGVGLENLKRMLALFYPDQETLSIREDEQCFIAEIRLPIGSESEVL